jgi:lipase maturation factor 1
MLLYLFMADMRRRTTTPSFAGTVAQPRVTTYKEPQHECRGESRIFTKDEVTRTADHSYIVARWAILRLLGAVYFVAFLGAYFQNLGLIGTHGLQPASNAMKRLRQSVDPGTTPWQGFMEHPTLFWWFDVTDFRMQAFAATGMLLSSSVMLLGLNSWFVMFVLWLLDFSIVTIARETSFYAYGWESQLLETGFLSIFLCELPHLVHEPSSGWRVRALWKDSNPPATSSVYPSPLIMWLFRWLCFRIALGAGLIKIRGSSCWARKTCLWYHFETQPIPSPSSFFFHFLPKWVLSRAVDLDLLVQVYTSWMVLVPDVYIPGFRDWGILTFLRRSGGFLQAGFMVNIMLSGNFAFLNHLTMIPALACLDDKCWPSNLRRLATGAQLVGLEGSQRKPVNTIPPRIIIDVALGLLIGYLSFPVITNLLQYGGSRQVMNGSFDNFRLVNTYGAFGDVGQARYEPIVSLRMNGTEWIELEFPCKPGQVTRRPCFCAPYHYRLDWNIWFIGFPPHSAYLQQREKWLYILLEKILGKGSTNERPWLNLLARPSAALLRQHYGSADLPSVVKVDMYHYQMAAPLWSLIFHMIVHRREVIWWRREFKESLIPPVQLDSTMQKLILAS